MAAVGPDVIALVESGAIPTSPEAIGHGEEHPVATWRWGDLAAVLSITQGPDDGTEQYIELFRRSNGQWHSDASCGSDWPVDYGDRPSWVDGATLTGLSCHCPAGAAWSGIASRDVHHVRAEFEDATYVEAPVEPVTGAFVVGGTGVEKPSVTAVGSVPLDGGRRLGLDGTSAAPTIQVLVTVPPLIRHYQVPAPDSQVED